MLQITLGLESFLSCGKQVTCTMKNRKFYPVCYNKPIYGMPAKNIRSNQQMTDKYAAVYSKLYVGA